MSNLVHYVRCGKAGCGKPSRLVNLARWTPDWDYVTCPDCLRTKPMPEKPTVIHYMHSGYTACGISDPPNTWPAHHKWEAVWAHVTCPVCLAFKDVPPTYEIVDKGNGFKCLRCSRISYNPKDVERHYCGCCHAFHDDILPTCRAWWLTTWGEQQEQEVAMTVMRAGVLEAFKHGAKPEHIKARVEMLLADCQLDLDAYLKRIQTRIKK